MSAVIVAMPVEDELGLSTRGAVAGGCPSAGPSYVHLSRAYVGKSSTLRFDVGGCSTSSCDLARGSPGGAPVSMELAGPTGPAGLVPVPSGGGVGGGGRITDGGSMMGVCGRYKKKS